MDRRAWLAAVHGVAKSQTWLRDFTFTFHFHALEKEMATDSSVLAWRIPGTGESGGLPSMGSHRVGYDWSNLAAAPAALLMVQPSHPYMTTQTFVGKVMPLLSRLVIAFLPRIKHLLISWLQSPSEVILETKKRKSVTTFTFSPSEVRAQIPWS